MKHTCKHCGHGIEIEVKLTVIEPKPVSVTRRQWRDMIAIAKRRDRHDDALIELSETPSKRFVLGCDDVESLPGHPESCVPRPKGWLERAFHYNHQIGGVFEDLCPACRLFAEEVYGSLE